ncbi:cytochrome d ubiquinol oxidase subunit II [Kribbella amoyensis]|uniref:Cytochrome d ubiquinol oxidase subunit II n=1 Tax=Kribbella amoyensis TaxID=996641 RepID=A0A561BUG3_9ACTN|nr:cytochrome d ubiquinol oxidase subunit II [Kribbella amoyensis]TWD82488.1 cytochrome d ubiquinol oxidase subunit II [Kribbella amoyensis]
MSTTIAVVLLLALAAYAVFGGADFGAGFWDLTAGGPEQGAAPRAVIDRSIGAVWEANHVWLIFIFVVTWSAFSPAYAAIMLTMYVPLTLAALGIVLRGSSFAFRKSVATLRYRRIFGGGFALSSVLVPFCMGAIAGGIASGQVPAGGKAGDPVDSWLNLASIVTGVFAVVVAAYLASVYLVRDARSAGDTAMVEYFRRRAVVTAVVAAVVAGVDLIVLNSKASYVFDGLMSRGLALVILSVLCGFGALVLLVRNAARGARVLAILAVASIIGSWGAAQWPYLLPESLKVSEAAAPDGTLTALLVAVGVALVLVVPGFVLLYLLHERQLLPEEGAEDVSDRSPAAR